MTWLRRHLIAVAVVVIALAVTGSVFAFARPEYHPNVPLLKNEPPPYTRVTYDVRAVRQAFRRAGLALATIGRGPLGTTLGDHGGRYILEVDVWGDPGKLEKSGFHDITTIPNLKVGRDCSRGTQAALHWRGNVRVIVACARTTNGQRWVRQVKQALARL
jgi:hypothetical protein